MASVITGSVKLTKVMPLNVALAAEPLNQPSQVAKTTVKMTPETYSGVAVLAIARIESVRSVLDPSLMPARTPMMSAPGTMTIITQNIRMPVDSSAGNSLLATLVRNFVEQPKSPSKTPERCGSTVSPQ